uniref:Myb-like domain-containing protein n=1 Tax=Monopterus albus TaxID=43700 RepID=A0A3Q3IX65_MONAL
MQHHSYKCNAISVWLPIDCIVLLSAIKTDLSLLLECLKFQMKCPDLQKQALLTIQSICDKREDNVDLLREMGGVAFVYNLSKSSIVHSDVKETALFTLGTLAEANVYCKNSLCRKETFAGLAGSLMKEGIPLTHKRVSVYLLSVLVANNKLGQILAQTTSCLDILLHLFRTTFPTSRDTTLRLATATQTHQLWTSVSSALCGCVNNPQNEEGQRICVTAFPILKIWLQQMALPRTEIFQPICSFIAMAVANNASVQESFSASGGLETLTLALVRLASAVDHSVWSCQLCVILSKTLSACIADNFALASRLAQYGIVSHLFSLLASPNLDSEDRLSLLLTLSHCTEASGEHQSQLVQCGGLPLIITLLTEDTSEDVRKAATFILQTCKQATVSFGVRTLTARDLEGENPEALTNLERYRSSARVLLRRIDSLEKRQEAEDELEDTDPPTSNEGLGQSSLPPARNVPPHKTIPITYSQSSTVKHAEAEGDNSSKLHTFRNMITKENDSQVKKISLSTLKVKAKTSGEDMQCSVCRGTGALMSSHVWSLEGGREPHTADSHLFKPPAPVWHSVFKCANEEELQDSEVSAVGKIPVEEQPLSHTRCAGCVLSFEEVTSHTFASLQTSCRHSCDMHKVLQEATEQFMAHHCSLLMRRKYQGSTVKVTDPNCDRASAAEPQLTGRGERSTPEYHWSKHNERRGQKSAHCGPDDEPKTSTDSTRRERKDFSQEEVRYLLSGVKKFGFSWNSILWSYSFQPGRTNVDLAKKYKRLMVISRDILIQFF